MFGMTLMDINMATGLRAELENNNNKALLCGAALAINSFCNLQKNISQITEGLSLFEDEIPLIANSKPKEDAKTKSEGDIIPITGIGNPSKNEEDLNKERGNDNNKNKGKNKGKKNKEKKI